MRAPYITLSVALLLLCAQVCRASVCAEFGKEFGKLLNDAAFKAGVQASCARREWLQLRGMRMGPAGTVQPCICCRQLLHIITALWMQHAHL